MFREPAPENEPSTSLGTYTGSAYAAFRRLTSASKAFLISQSVHASDAYLDFQRNIASVEALKQGLIVTANRLAQTRAALVDRRVTEDEFQRLRTDQDIRYIDEEFRKLQVRAKTAELFVEQKPNAETCNTTGTDEQVEAEWLDKFDEYAKRNNEPWRRELLAKALLSEANSPGSVGPRALWFIGTVEEHLFNVLSSLLDLTTSVAGGLVVPMHNQFSDRLILSLGAEQLKLPNITFQLGELGVIGDSLTSSFTVPQNSTFYASYGDRHALITCQHGLEIRGIIPTLLGTAVARIHTKRPNPLGTEIFETWIGALDPTSNIIRKNW